MFFQDESSTESSNRKSLSKFPTAPRQLTGQTGSVVPSGRLEAIHTAVEGRKTFGELHCAHAFRVAFSSVTEIQGHVDMKQRWWESRTAVRGNFLLFRAGIPSRVPLFESDSQVTGKWSSHFVFCFLFLHLVIASFFPDWHFILRLDEMCDKRNVIWKLAQQSVFSIVLYKTFPTTHVALRIIERLTALCTSQWTSCELSSV